MLARQPPLGPELPVLALDVVNRRDEGVANNGVKPGVRVLGELVVLDGAP